MTERRPGPIIHINGYPGVGKYTIAKRLTELFPRLKLVHNKLFTDLADALVPRDTDDHFKAWESFLEMSFEPILWSDETFDYGYIFTNFIPSDEDSPVVVMRDYIYAATCRDDRQREFIAITFVCDEQENVRRLVSVERQQGGKLTDPESLRVCRTSDSQHDYLGDCHHVIDVTNLEVEAAALAIAHRVGLRQ
ncbi:uncharacterized protein B0J16DRAFT_401745 [Fusarium flagelliforme]|uniref:Aaa atpase family protein n=1 Tax=Fusarium flagelliforme TaxID=2675880 RepID=A0A395MKZ8_9HYPO|nr:uncharacterized protein B0J16DRAFT_401745 [Fusarium flagelliforme]KAH7183418.1 hypothetical protein B0J16DRAFT_401745 [Fusarium flagelliforme]RFN48487.1 aaa atpase family protein [Fusarium flagelliforme]